MRFSTVALLVTLAACSNQNAQSAATPVPNGPPARLDLARAVAAHPLASMLREYDDDLTTLRLTRTPQGLTAIPARVAADVADTRNVLDAAARQTAALAIRAPQVPANGTPPDRGANAIASYRDALEQRNQRALELRASQLRESEADAAYEFDRAHAGTRLQLRVKLRNLHLDVDKRHRMQAELDAMQAQENAIVENLRRSNETTLADFAGQLQREGIDNLNELAADVVAHRQAAAQLRDGMRAPAPQLSVDDRAAAAQAYRINRVDIAQRLNDVATQDRSASSRIGAAIADLQGARATLRAEIVASIEATTRAVAGERGLGRVYESNAPSGADDLTAAVIARMQQAP
ncbi:MAG TPA: hypothetical protein VN936_04545 [Candidatus Acidoferrum sp.]|nr:hypothetical protein [Candidatus Acidoferrum sp.]